MINNNTKEIFSIKVADRQTDASTDSKGRLKLTSRASPIIFKI